MGNRLLVALLVFAAPIAAVSSCDTDAVAVEDCREIERARCRASPPCDFGIETNDQVELCERFARDNCLHGFEIDEDPGGNDVSKCVATIEAASECARQSGPDFRARDCQTSRGDGERLETATANLTVCELIQQPEEAVDCQFLIPEPPEPEPEDAGVDAAGLADAATD